MEYLKFNYSTTYYFDKPVTTHNFSIKCLPKTSNRQRIDITEKRITSSEYCSDSKDSFGNQMIYGVIEESHTEFNFTITGTAEVDNSSVETDKELLDLFTVPSKLVEAGPVLLEHINAIKGKCSNMNRADICLLVNNYVNQMLEYKQWETDVNTPAEEACSLGHGVCQDYSHIMISILRSMNIPARYVVGMMKGEGFSHAWVEAWLDEGKPEWGSLSPANNRAGWYGFDPTNDKPVDDGYIKISHGRDYADCMVVRGIFLGAATQKQMVLVNVEEL